MKKSFGDYFINDRKKLYIIFSIVLMSIFSLTVIYAALSVTLNITGNAEVVASSWDIHLDNIIVKSGSVSGTVPSIVSPTTASFSTNLTTPGDFYEFSIDVVNDGTIDAMIDSVSKTPTLTAAQAKYLKYEITYQTGESISTKQLVSSGSFVRLKVRIEFRKDISASDIPTSSEILNLKFTVNYIQADGSGSVVADNGVYDPYKVGNEVCFDTECFYIISSDEDSVSLLAKYNLYIGKNKGAVSDEDKATGRQDSNMIGYKSGLSVYRGVIEFASNNYWSGTVSSYPSYVYNEKSSLYTYVENYRAYLNSIGVIPFEVRLITNIELENLGCANGYCKSAPKWVYSTTYWSGTAYGTMDIIHVSTDCDYFGAFYNYYEAIGIRPVIVVDKSLI